MHHSSSSRPGVDVDAIIDTLWGSFHLYGSDTRVLLEHMIEQLCSSSRDILLNEPRLLHLQPPIIIAGDFYGEYSKLKSVLEQNGPPPRSNYLFLGNYVDSRGHFCHTILLLLAFKIKYPQNVFLLKGDIEHAGIKPGMQVDELNMMMRCVSSSSMNILNDCLTFLPVAALISNKIICTNSGLSPHLHSLGQIKPHSPLLDDLIWTHSGRRGRVPVAKEAEFLEKNDLRLVCCGDHKVVSKYKDFAEHRVVFVSSASDRQELYDTYLASEDDNTVMRVDVSLNCSFQNLRYKKKLWSYQIGKASTTQDVCSSEVNPSSGKVDGSKPETNFPSKIQFDPTNLYRSKSPGVKRFLGARV